MTALILAVLSAVLLVIGVPIFIVLLTAAVIGVWMTGNPIQAVHSAMFGSLDIFPLLAVPLFIYAGDIMSRGGMARRLIEMSCRSSAPCGARSGSPPSPRAKCSA